MESIGRNVENLFRHGGIIFVENKYTTNAVGSLYVQIDFNKPYRSKLGSHVMKCVVLPLTTLETMQLIRLQIIYLQVK